MKQVYHLVFDEALAAYNAKKKKTRDKILDYYEHIRQEQLEEERSFSAQLLAGIDAALDFLWEHLPEPLRPLVEKAQQLIPVPDVQEPKRERDRGHSWGGMEL